MKNHQIKILLVDDHQIVIDGCSILLKQHGFATILTATDGNQAIQLAVKHKPDIIIVDISMDSISGLAVIESVKKRGLDPRIIVFSMHDDPGLVKRAFAMEIHAYVEKNNSPNDLITAVNNVLEGKRYLSENMTRNIAFNNISSDKQSIIELLSVREYEIFTLLLKGHTISEIAETMHIKPKSVSNYIATIKNKLEVRTLSELAYLGYQLGIIPTVAIPNA